VPSPAEALPQLDPVLHAQTRLQLTSVLARLDDGEELVFPRLQELLGLTAGNLSTHLRRLEEAGYVAVTKTHRDRVPVTGVALTPVGRDRFRAYATTMLGYLNGSAVDRILAPEGSRWTHPRPTDAGSVATGTVSARDARH